MDEHTRILIVDDDERTRFVLYSAFEKLGNGYEIVTAQDGQEALDKARTAAFDLVITDLIMPDVNGVELTREIKALNPETHVIWVTAYGCHGASAIAAQLSVYKCLDKPLKVSKIRQIAQKALEDTGQEPE